MALMHLDFFSDTLKIDSSVHIIFPQKCERSPSIPEGPYKVLYLLHGLKQNETSYLRNSNVERYVRNLPLVVVMPSVDRSFYTDQVRGYPYFTYLTEELPTLLSSLFAISTKAEDTAIAGLSMGGYGALKVALTYPERYSAAASMSGAVDLVDLSRKIETDGQIFPYEFENTFGVLEDLENSRHNLFALARGIAETEGKPRLYLTCGSEDYLLGGNRKFVSEFSSTFPLVYDEYPGAHTWDFWDSALQRVLSFLYAC
ncbi:MAG: alpha/beta hydrolase family protein [Sphaerochaeta sp.]|uniref:alpha/beta hydrolase n=1 Tax=Sphaerochaeta sp. TaxID=1972642 RepID=UPI002FC5AFD8